MSGRMIAAILACGLVAAAPADVVGEGGLVVRSRIASDRIVLPEVGIEASGVTLDVAREGAATTAALSVGVLRLLAEPSPVVPLAATGEARRTDGEPIRFTLTATSADGALTADVGGTYDPDAAAGRADVRIRPIRLAEDGRTLARLFPALGGAVSATAGDVAARLRLTLEGGVATGGGEVLLENVSVTAGGVAASGVNGVVRFEGLTAPSIPRGQTVAVKLLDVGLPLTNGVVTFGYGADGALVVDGARWGWAGGALRAEPFRIDPSDPKGQVLLEADGVDLGRLLELAGVEGLSATGVLSGRLPVRFDRGRVRIDAGVLEATGPGALRYDPAAPPSFLAGDPGSPTDLLMGALTDFRYDALSLTVDGTAGDEMEARLSVAGHNPAFFDGYPVKLNLNVSGALDRILRQSLDAYRIPDAVRDRMTEFGRKEP